MKAIIIEDSRLARAELKHLLAEHEEVELLAEAVNAEEGKSLIEKHQPDLIFLDIQMPGKSGFELLEDLDEVPSVIFTTAYNEYAVKSFEYNALDYLLKPIKPERLKIAIDKAMNTLNTPKASASKDYMDEDAQVFVKDGEKCWLVKLTEIRLFEINGNYTRIYFEKNKPMILKSLQYLETRLDPSIFFRANRQQIINLKWVQGIDNWFNGKIKARLKGGEEIEVSRRQANRLKEILSF